MGNFNYSVGELTSMIKKESKMNLALLGNTESDQNTYIFYYLTEAMWKFVDIAFVIRITDPLVVSEEGFVTFKRNNVNVEDLYEQLRIINSSTQVLLKRNSWDLGNGWWREGANMQIHIRGNGTYVMHYKAYPAKASSADQILEWPASSYDLLQYETIGKIKESMNDTAGAKAAYDVADKLIPVLIQTNIAAQGTSLGRPPSMNAVQNYRR